MKILRSCDQNHQVRPLKTSQLVVIREWEIFALGHQSWQKDDVAVDLWWCLTIFVQQKDRRVAVNLNIACLFSYKSRSRRRRQMLQKENSVYLISEKTVHCLVYICKLLDLPRVILLLLICLQSIKISRFRLSFISMVSRLLSVLFLFERKIYPLFL